MSLESDLARCLYEVELAWRHCQDKVHPHEAYLGLRDWQFEWRLIMKEAMEQSITQSSALNELARICHEENKKWWLDLTKRCLTCITKQDSVGCADCGGTGYCQKDRNVGELIALCHSELSEALEGHRKNLMDDKLPTRKMFDVELADLLIRVFDLCGGLKINIGEVFVQKMAFNRHREDHQIEQRLQPEGKSY